MVSRRLTVLTFASLALIGANGARAADYTPPPPPPVYVQPPPPPPEFAGGWYRRGDIGFSSESVRSLSNDNYSRFDSVQNVDKDFDSAPFFGIGIGYTVNNWLRIDGTAEYRG